MVAMTDRLAEVRRLLDRYLVEVVEAYNFCPWARQAREGGEIAVGVIWGRAPALAQWEATANELLARAATRVAMVVAPELAATPGELREIRETIARRVAHAGVAEFHPDGALDLATPPRLVPFVRRSPDPMLQLVPLALLDSVRSPVELPELSEQARLLGGVAVTEREDIADRIAVLNHNRVRRDLGALQAVLDDIAADRARSYPRVGIELSTRR